MSGLGVRGVGVSGCRGVGVSLRIKRLERSIEPQWERALKDKGTV